MAEDEVFDTLARRTDTLLDWYKIANAHFKPRPTSKSTLV